MIEPITDHFEQAKAKLLSRYKDKPRFLALLASYIRQLQDIEDALWDVILVRSLDGADMTRLQVIGRLVGQPYKGEIQAIYKQLIEMRILTNRSQGQSTDIIAIVEVMLSGLTIELDDTPPAAFLLQVESNLGSISPLAVRDQIREAKAAGVGFQLIYQTFTDAFTFSATTNADVDATHGFSSTTSLSTGGGLVAVL